MDLKKFNVTVRVVSADDGKTISEYVLPVDSPDAEHAASSTMANAISFTEKQRSGEILPIAFQCVRIERRN